tara:strand:+ start:1245 stop:1424 length:180 start_codon:yes stop_codon:yes gene_type:complete
MIITSAKYTLSVYDDKKNDGIEAVIDGETMYIPLVEGNTHYDEILKQVEEKTLTIEDAD